LAARNGRHPRHAGRRSASGAISRRTKQGVAGYGGALRHLAPSRAGSRGIETCIRGQHPCIRMPNDSDACGRFAPNSSPVYIALQRLVEPQMRTGGKLSGCGGSRASALDVARVHRPRYRDAHRPDVERLSLQLEVSV
jgi:hypothetical protein